MGSLSVKQYFGDVCARGITATTLTLTGDLTVGGAKLMTTLRDHNSRITAIAGGSSDVSAVSSKVEDLVRKVDGPQGLLTKVGLIDGLTAKLDQIDGLASKVDGLKGFTGDLSSKLDDVAFMANELKKDADMAAAQAEAKAHAEAKALAEANAQAATHAKSKRKNTPVEKLEDLEEHLAKVDESVDALLALIEQVAIEKQDKDALIPVILPTSSPSPAAGQLSFRDGVVSVYDGKTWRELAFQK